MCALHWSPLDTEFDYVPKTRDIYLHCALCEAGCLMCRYDGLEPRMVINGSGTIINVEMATFVANANCKHPLCMWK